jgi:hypothetical protein
VPQRKTGISSSHRTVVTDPEISRRNLVRSSGLSHLLSSRHYGSGFIKAKARVLVNGTPESPIPDFPKRVISQHVTSLNRTVHNCSGVSTQESPDPLSPGLPISRFPISRNGEISRRVASINLTAQIYPGVFTMEKSRTLVNRNPDSAIPDFPKWELLRHVASVHRTAQIHPGISSMESPDLLSTGLPISRLPVSRSG